MFDFTSARQHMVDSQIRTGDVTDPDIIRAFRTTERENFVPKPQRALAYSDAHIKLGDGRYLIKPRDFAKMVDAVDISPTDVVLDVGCGRGYSTAILAQLAETVVGLEDSEERVARASDDLVAAGISNAAVVQGDLKSGASEHGPFNVIFVNGAVHEVPDTWLSQLANKGRLVAVVQDGPVGRACVFTRSGDTVGQRVAFDATLPMLEDFKPVPTFVL